MNPFDLPPSCLLRKRLLNAGLADALIPARHDFALIALSNATDAGRPIF